MASVTKRKWKKPDGSTGEAWMVRYVDATGARRGKTFYLKKQADAFRQKFEREIEDGIHTADRNAATVAAVLKHYMQWNDTRVRDGRVGVERSTTIETQARLYILPALAAVRFRDITTRQVTDLYAKVLAAGRTPAYAKAVVQNLRTIEGFARRHGYLKTNPVADAMYELRGIKADPVAVLTTESILRRAAGCARVKFVRWRGRTSTSMRASCTCVRASRRRCG